MSRVGPYQLSWIELANMCGADELSTQTADCVEAIRRKGSSIIS